MAALQQAERTLKLAANQLLHRDGAGELAAHRRGLPHPGHGCEGILLAGLAVCAAIGEPVQPHLRALRLARHVVVDAQPLACRDVERAAHQQLRMGERLKPRLHICVAHGLLRQRLNARAPVDMPLAPVPKAAQLNVGHKAVAAKPLAQRLHGLRVISCHALIVIVR